MADLSSIRYEYTRAGLHERDLAADPISQLDKWLAEAIAAQHPEPTAMTLSTATPEGDPSARVVLLKVLEPQGLVFFTGYESDKGRQISANPRVCASFFWVQLERQVRVSGRVSRVSREQSEGYFRGRPRESQLGAWASAQSSVLRDREELEARLADVRSRFGDSGEVTCPPDWGGYVLIPNRVEFWQGRPSRLHDRLLYRLSDSSGESGVWSVSRLSP